MYADIGQLPYNQLQRSQPRIPALEDTPIEYAKINLRSLSDKKKTPQMTYNGII